MRVNIRLIDTKLNKLVKQIDCFVDFKDKCVEKLVSATVDDITYEGDIEIKTRRLRLWEHTAIDRDKVGAICMYWSNDSKCFVVEIDGSGLNNTMNIYFETMDEAKKFRKIAYDWKWPE